MDKQDGMMNLILITARRRPLFCLHSVAPGQVQAAVAGNKGELPPLLIDPAVRSA